MLEIADFIPEILVSLCIIGIVYYYTGDRKDI